MITGASGFIGRFTVKALMRPGIHVIAATRDTLRSRAIAPDAEWIKADLLDPQAAKRIVDAARADTLLHLAWDVSPGYWTSDKNADWLAASQRLARYFADRGGKRIVSAGTCAEYDWSSKKFETENLCETMGPFAPSTPYAVAKLSLRNDLTKWSREIGISYAAGLLFFAFGPHEHPSRLVPAVINDLIAGRTVRTSTGYQVRDYIDVRDAAQALAMLATGSTEGAVNIGSGQGHSIRDIVSCLKASIAPDALVDFGALPDRPNEPPRLVANIRRLTEEVGFSPKDKQLESLSHSIEYWRRHILE